MCRWHWRKVPRDVQAAVWAHFNPAQCKPGGPRPSVEWLAAARQALNWATGAAGGVVVHVGAAKADR